MQKRSYAVGLAKFYLRLGRGHALVDFLVSMTKNIVYLGVLGELIKKWFGFTPPFGAIIFIGVSFEIFCYTLGYFDERIGFWKFQNHYSSENLNPYGEELMRRVKRIEDKVHL